MGASVTFVYGDDGVAVESDIFLAIGLVIVVIVVIGIIDQILL